MNRSTLIYGYVYDDRGDRTADKQSTQTMHHILHRKLIVIVTSPEADEPTLRFGERTRNICTGNGESKWWRCAYER